MQIKTSTAFGALSLALLPGVAHAQHIPVWLALAAVSPVAVILLCIFLGVVNRSWRIGAIHAALVIIWVVLFGLASYFVTNDYVIWTPIFLYAIHANLILVLIVVGIANRSRGSRRTR
jgi:inner membrane protein involved in colicin E2 resistance